MEEQSAFAGSNYPTRITLRELPAGILPAGILPDAGLDSGFLTAGFA